jgi:hypothetical protein
VRARLLLLLLLLGADSEANLGRYDVRFGSVGGNNVVAFVPTGTPLYEGQLAEFDGVSPSMHHALVCREK